MQAFATAESVKKVPPKKRIGSGREPALRKRLVAGVPTLEDRAVITYVQAIQTRRDQGMTYEQVARELGKGTNTIYKFVKSAKFTAVSQYLDAQALGKPMVGAPEEPLAKQHRGVIQRLVPKALERLELSLDAGISTDFGVKTLIESKAADHAMDTVLEAAGLLEPEGGGVRPVIHIDTLVIQGLTQDIRADDARIARAVDVTPVAAP